MSKKSDRWDNVYKKGAHWESKKPSEDIKEFIKYLEKDNRILDVGCGSGRDIIYLAKKGFDSYGVDISPVAIGKIRKIYKKKNLKLYIAQTEHLPFKKDFFDAIFCTWVLHFTDIERAVSEIRRVLKKDGVLYVGFILNQKFIKTGKTIDIISKRKIFSLFKKFKRINKIEYESNDEDDKEPHKHDVLILVLRR